MLIIGLTGLPRAGKDTVANRLAEEHGFLVLSFAKPLKEAAAILLDRPLSECNGEGGFDREAIMPEWGFSMRWFLQRFGTECLRDQIRKDFWTAHMQRRIKQARLVGWQRIVITDCRFQNETDTLRSLGGTIVEIVRPGTKGSDHPSDARVLPDVTLVNSSTIAALYADVDRLVFDLSPFGELTAADRRVGLQEDHTLPQESYGGTTSD